MLQHIWLSSGKFSAIFAVTFGLWGFFSIGLWQGIVIAAISLILSILSPIAVAVAVVVFFLTNLWYVALPVMIIGFIIEGRAIQADVRARANHGKSNR